MKKQLIMKIASMATALSLVASSGAAAVSAATKTTAASSGSSTEEKEQRAMKEALTVVKKRVKIPDSISKFNYGVSQSYGEECFNFTWETPEDSKSTIRECINISVVQNIIVSYNYSKYYTDGSDKNDRAPAFAKLSDKQLIEKAKGYCKQLNPDLTSISDIEISSVSLFEDYAYVTFGRKENGIDIPDNGGSIAMNKDTGELISYGISGWYYDGTEFASPKSKLTAAEAQAKYKEYCTLTPSYRIITTWNEEKKDYDRKPVLIYSPDFTDEIDALTGEKSTFREDMSKDKGTNWFPFANYAVPSFDGAEVEEDCVDEDVAAGAADNGVVFTKEELAEIEADETMLKKEEITALLQKDKYIQLPDYVPLKRAELVKDEKKDLYKYTMVYSYNDDEEAVEYAEGEEAPAQEIMPYYSLYITLDAKTGKVDNFSKSYAANLDNSKAYPVKSCSAIADKVIKYYYPDICGEYKADESNLAASDSWTDSKGKTYYETSRRFVYHRYVNGVIVEGDNIYVTVDNKGNVNNVSYNYTDVKFPSSVPEFDNDKAFTQIFKQLETRLYYDGYYKPDGTVKTYLLYDIDSFYLNSKYQIVDWSGEVVTKTEKNSGKYTDIDGIKQKTAIETLARYGITLSSEDGKFDPNKAITDKEFRALVSQAIYGWGRYSSSENEKSSITNKEAAQIFVDIMGGTKFAELKGIYKAPFDDVKATDEYAGYIAIAKAMGFMNGTNGKFEPDKKISRAKAMQMIYDYILYLNK